MFEKVLLHTALKRAGIANGTLRLTYWDGTERVYGNAHTGPHLDVTIANRSVVWKLLRRPSIGLGEGYMYNNIQIDEDQLPALFELLALNKKRVKRGTWRYTKNRKRDQRRNIFHHYDVGNDYYRLWLDTATMLYTCAYFQDEHDSLERAQLQKIDLVLRKLRLQPGQHLLDIGCGWGHLAVEAAKQYGVYAFGITLSEEQLMYARELAERESVSHLVHFQLMNYQDLPKIDTRYDAVVSVGMIEHIGKGNLPLYFSVVNTMLKEGGIVLTHCITKDASDRINPFVDKHVFPGGHLARPSEIEAAMEASGLWSVHCENLWLHYALTLMHWRKRHQAHRDEIVAMFTKKYGPEDAEAFYRMRDLWLAGSIAGFLYFGMRLDHFLGVKGKPLSWPLTYTWIYKTL